MLVEIAIISNAHASPEFIQKTLPSYTLGLSHNGQELYAAASDHHVKLAISRDDIVVTDVGPPYSGYSIGSLYVSDASSPSGPVDWLLTKRTENNVTLWVDALTGDRPLGDTWARSMVLGQLNDDGVHDLIQNGSIASKEGYQQQISQWVSSSTGYAFTSAFYSGEAAFVLDDINNDNRSDLLVIETHYEDSSGFFLHQPRFAEDSTLRLYPGGVNGFDTNEAWELKLDLTAVFAVAIQLDADPEREILLFGAANASIYDAYSPQLFIVDPQPGGSPTVTYDPTFFYANIFEDIWDLDFQLINDADADGIDDVVVRIGQELVLLGSATRFTWPTSLHVFTIQGISDPDLIEFLTHDVDADGHDDVVAIYVHKFGPSDDYTTTMKVWFGPFNEPEPVEETADTGQSIPDDTSGTGTTADTATAAPIEPTPTEPSKCGCSSDATAATMFLPLLTLFAVRRRHQRE